MLECTWNDTEAEIALRRLTLKEQKKQASLANDPTQRNKIRESTLSRLAVKSIDASADSGSNDTL